MKLIRNPEVRGIVVLVLIMLVLGVILVIATGKLEQWFGITWFSGPRALDKIIFVSDRSGTAQLYIMNTDGSDVKPLTEDARVVSAPAISPTGTRIAFVGMVGGASQIMTVGAAGGGTEQLTGSSTPKRLVEYSPDGKKLAFIASGRVYAAEADGSNPDVILPTDKQLHAAMADPTSRETPVYDPRSRQTPVYVDYAWGPDSESIAGVIKKEEDGSEVLVYLPKTGADLVPFGKPQEGRSRIPGMAWAADSPLLAVSTVVGNKAWLLMFDADEQKPYGAEFDGWELGNPAVSPDGSAVTVPFKTTGKNGKAGLVTVSPGSGRTEVIAEGNFQNPAYSPDGEAILAVQLEDKGKTRNVVSIDPTSGEVKKLTTDGGSFDAIWSPISEK